MIIILLFVLVIIMVLDIPGGLFGDGGLFKPSPEDGQTGLFFGDREIPGGISNINQSSLKSTAGTLVSDSTVGTVAWINPTNASASDDSYTTAAISNPGTATEDSIKIVKGGSISGDEKSEMTEVQLSDAIHTIGSSADLWGVTWTPADINASGFGVVISLRAFNISEYLKVTNFSFNIPAGSTILGIEVKFEAHQTGPVPIVAFIDHVEITVFYLESSF